MKNGICQEIRLIGKNRHSRTAAIEINGVAYVPFHDSRGNISALATLQGEVVERYRYTAYGEREILGPSGESRLKSAIGNPWQYGGKRIDEETQLIAFGMRYYDPTLGRWTTPDPAGFADGSNLYSYVHNNPFQYFDQFGLFADTLSFATKSWCPFLEDNYQHFSSFLGSGTIQDPQFGCVNHFSIEDQLQREHQLREPFQRTQHYRVNDLKDAKGNLYQYKEMPPGKKILFECGIGNTFKDFKESLDHLAKASGGYNVEGIFCPTFGLPLDYKTYDHALRDKACFEGTRLFQQIVREFHANQPAGATMLVMPHSRGCVYVRNGLIDLGLEHRERVDVRAFAPGAYIDPHLCKSVRHYVSTRDGVPWMDRAGRERCKDTIIILQPHPKACLHDHNVTSPTYVGDIEAVTKKYIRT